MSTTFEVPFFTASNRVLVRSKGTNGSNPWLDGIFYEAQLGRSIDIALNRETPAYSYYFLKPADLSLVQRKPAMKEEAQLWMGVGRRKGIAGVSNALSHVFKSAYQAISDVCLLRFRQAVKPQDANVWIANAYFTDYGSLANGGIFLGSHEGLVDYKSGQKSAAPLLQTLNAFQAEAEEILGSLGSGRGAYATIIHEACHGLGLSHPHDSGLGGSMSGVFPGLVPNDSFGFYGTGLFGLTQSPYTIMSYKRGYTNTTITAPDQVDVDNCITPMALDVAAIQVKYGTNRQTRKDDTTYTLNSNVWQCIYDAGGNDWIRISIENRKTQMPRNALINLRPAEMNAIRPQSDEPMEAYVFGKGKMVDFAINTMISTQTSMIGAPLGMGLVFAEKIRKVLDGKMPKDRLAALVGHLNDLGAQLKALEAEGVNILQLLTSVKQYLDAYEFNSLKTLSVAEIKAASVDFGALPDAKVAIIKKILEESSDFSDRIESDYKKSFAGQVGAGSYVADVARLQDLQQQILERSVKGIAGYPSYVEGLNGGFTIAAGVLIENAQGGAGNDQIIGNAENNTLVGLEGDDVLEGYLGADTLTGGPGADVFAYANVSDSPPVSDLRDTITDFRPIDRISLKQLRTNRALELQPLSKTLPDSFTLDYIGAKAFSKREGEVRFAGSTLSVDVDGDAAMDLAIHVPGITGFSATNLIL